MDKTDLTWRNVHLISCQVKVGLLQKQFLPDNLLLQGLLMGYSFFQGVCICCSMESSMGCSMDICSNMFQSAPICSSTSCRWTICFTVVLPMVFRGISAPAHPHTLSLTLVSVELFFSHFSHSSTLKLLYSSFYLFLNMLPQRCHQHWCAHLSPVVGLFCNQQELALPDKGQPLLSPHKGHSFTTRPCHVNSIQ